MSNEIKDIENTIQDLQLSKAKEDIDLTYQTLVSDYKRAVIPEGLFRDYFLPYLTGYVELPSGKNIVAEWVAVAGSPVAEVDIEDVNGNILLTVPPLFSSDVNLLSKTNTFTTIYKEFDLRMNNIPSAAINKLNNDLSVKAGEISESVHETVDGNRKRWLDILAKYGYTENTNTEGTNDHIDDFHDDLDYD